jgi:hypothetical protein
MDVWPEAQLEAETGGLMKKIEHVSFSVLSSQIREGIVENNHSKKNIKQRHTIPYSEKYIDKTF